VKYLPQNHFGAILADPPWRYEVWSEGSQKSRLASAHYDVLTTKQIAELPVAQLAADDCVLFIWITWPQLLDSIKIIEAWGFKYKTCAFAWIKAHANQVEMFRDDLDGQLGMGYWTRANSEVCLLATKGKPKRLSASVRQAIIAPRKEHSRKPDGIHERIERLVAGPYLELFARQEREGWTVWGNQTDKFKPIVTSPTIESSTTSIAAGTLPPSI
jgi:N6-adenosine-specific RNA methylase IME4